MLAQVVLAFVKVTTFRNGGVLDKVRSDMSTWAPDCAAAKTLPSLLFIKFLPQLSSAQGGPQDD